MKTKIRNWLMSIDDKSLIGIGGIVECIIIIMIYSFLFKFFGNHIALAVIAYFLAKILAKFGTMIDLLMQIRLILKNKSKE